MAQFIVFTVSTVILFFVISFFEACKTSKGVVTICEKIDEVSDEEISSFVNSHSYTMGLINDPDVKELIFWLKAIAQVHKDGGEAGEYHKGAIKQRLTHMKSKKSS